MKIVVTGSLRHIRKPLAKELLENGHLVKDFAIDFANIFDQQ